MGERTMDTEPKAVCLKAWQWIIVLIIALAAGAIGGISAGGINITIFDNHSHAGVDTPDDDSAPRLVDEDD
jgi:hypothetical protein